MRKSLTTLLVAAALLVGTMSFAVAKDEPIALDPAALDEVTAGVGVDGTFVRPPGSFTIGSFTYVFDGSRWTRVRN